MNRVGLASYHFELDGPYISYEDIPDNWRLDDGSPPPENKYFMDPYYDEQNRRFTGWIDWSDNPFHGNIRWDYMIVFSEDW